MKGISTRCIKTLWESYWSCCCCCWITGRSLFLLAVQTVVFVNAGKGMGYFSTLEKHYAHGVKGSIQSTIAPVSVAIASRRKLGACHLIWRNCDVIFGNARRLPPRLPRSSQSSVPLSLTAGECQYTTWMLQTSNYMTPVLDEHEV